MHNNKQNGLDNDLNRLSLNNQNNNTWTGQGQCKITEIQEKSVKLKFRFENQKRLDGWTGIVLPQNTKDKKLVKHIIKFEKIDCNGDDRYFVLTPNFYGCVYSGGVVDSKKFPKTGKLDHQFHQNKDTKGVPAPFLDDLLAIEKGYTKEDYKKSIVIISTGVAGDLGARQDLIDALKQKKQNGEIKDYAIEKTVEAIRLHNQYIEKGEKVFTFLHTTC